MLKCLNGAPCLTPIPPWRRYPVSTFMDHLLRYQEAPDVKMLVLLGEVGGVEEYKVGRRQNAESID